MDLLGGRSGHSVPKSRQFLFLHVHLYHVAQTAQYRHWGRCWRISAPGWMGSGDGTSFLDLIYDIPYYFPVWTPPHFWALALYRQEDYQRARLPMMPLLRGRLATARHMVAYTLGLLMASLVLYGLDPGLALVYVVAAVLLGWLFLAAMVALWAGLKVIPEQRLFFTRSLAYMAALFAAMVVGTFFSY